MKIIVLCFLVFLNPANTDTHNQLMKGLSDTLDQKELEKRKTIAEIEKIDHELNAKNYAPWLQAGTLIAALIAAAISLITALKSQRIQSSTLNNQIIQHQKDKISDLLKELGSSDIAVKTAAIQALSEYESAFNFLIFMLKLENDHTIISVIAKALRKNVEFSIPLLIEETKLIHQEQFQLANNLVALKIDRKEVSLKLGLDNKEFQDWISTKSTSRIENLSSFDFGANVNTPIDRDAELIKLNSRWRTLINGYNNVIIVIEELFGIASAEKLVLKIENAYLNGLTLNGVDLKNWTFTNCIIDNSKIFNCSLENAAFSGINSKNTFIRGCEVENLKISDSSFKNGEFRNSKGKNLEFLNSKFYDMNFSGSNIRESKYTDCNWSVSDLQGSMFNDSGFFNTKFYSCNFSACFFQDASYDKVQITNSDFKTAKMINSKFLNSGLIKLQINRSSFEGSEFSFTRLHYVELINSNLSGVKIENSDLLYTRADEQTLTKDTVIDPATELKYCSGSINNLKTSPNDLSA